MASGAGLNVWGNSGGVTLLSLNPSAPIVASPLAGYGTTGVNDSWLTAGNNSSTDATGFTKWLFQLVPADGSTTFSGYSVTLYGTIDSRAYRQIANGNNPGQTTGITLPAGAWFVLPSPADQTGTGTPANPLTATNPFLNVSLPLVAVRAVLTASSTPTG